MHNLSDQHTNVVNHILTYLKSSPSKGIMLSRHEYLDMEGYTNSDFAESRLDRKSTLVYVSFVGGNLVTLRSKKQNESHFLVQKLNTVHPIMQLLNLLD